MNIDLTKLCFYDRRNPDFQIKEEYGYDKEEVEATDNYSKKDCACDNCFYGRSDLTEQLILQQEEKVKKKLTITLTEYSYECGDGCCTNFGNITNINGVDLDCHNQDTQTILQQVLEHLGYEVDITQNYDY